MIDDETRKYITLFRLEGLRLDWSVYYAARRPHDRADQLRACRDQSTFWDYFRKHKCHLLDDDMKVILKELER